MNDRLEYRRSLGLPTRKPTYDSKCYDLAAIFLGDEPDLHTEHNIVGLAALIQDTIEGEIAHLKEQWRALEDIRELHRLWQADVARDDRGGVTIEERP